MLNCCAPHTIWLLLQEGAAAELVQSPELLEIGLGQWVSHDCMASVASLTSIRLWGHDSCRSGDLEAGGGVQGLKMHGGLVSSLPAICLAHGHALHEPVCVYINPPASAPAA